MSTDPMDLAGWLEELEKEHAARAVVIASVRQRLGLDAAAPSATVAMPGAPRPNTDVSGPLRSDTFFRLSIPEAIKKFLNMAKRPQSPKDIAAALKQGGVLSQSSHFYANVTTALKRLRDAGDVVNTKEGWGLSEWYPNKPKQNEIPKAKRRGRKKAKKSSQPSPTVGPPTAGHSGNGKLSYTAFVAERRHAGKSMKEIGIEWSAMKAR